MVILKVVVLLILRVVTIEWFSVCCAGVDLLAGDFNGDWLLCGIECCCDFSLLLICVADLVFDFA